MKSFFRRKVFITFFLISTMILASLFTSASYAAKRDKISPTAPTGLRAVLIADKSVSLEWNTSTDNIGVKSYNIYRNNVLIGSSAATSFTNSGLTPATAYSYYVRAKDDAGNISGLSNTIKVTTLQSTTPTPTPTSTPTPTPTPTPAPTPTPTPAPTPTPTPTPSPTPTPTPIPDASGRIVGYYAAWSAYSGFTPDKIDALKLTHINYAFANISTDLKIAMGYPDIDPANFDKLKALKQINPNLKTLISVGGWTWSGKFSDVALTDASRTAFADSCVNFIVAYGFDGIDLDWEYPVNGGLASNVRRPEDKHNFTLLLQKIREKLDIRGLSDGRHYLLTIAGGSGSWYVDNIELGVLHNYLDFGNIMTYDIHGTWDRYTDFNSPLYNNTDVSPQYKWSVDSGVNAWLKAGIPAEKLVVGIPFYGHKYNMVNNENNGLYQLFSGGSSLSYAAIAAAYLNAPGYVQYFHSESMVPWLFNGTTFISYENARSISLKAQYIKSRALGGGAIWELSQDPDRVLLTSLFDAMRY